MTKSAKFLICKGDVFWILKQDGLRARSSSKAWKTNYTSIPYPTEESNTDCSTFIRTKTRNGCLFQNRRVKVMNSPTFVSLQSVPSWILKRRSGLIWRSFRSKYYVIKTTNSRSSAPNQTKISLGYSTTADALSTKKNRNSILVKTLSSRIIRAISIL
jgi:hypothetical protein